MTWYFCDGCTGGCQDPSYLTEIEGRSLCKDCIEHKAKGEILPVDKNAAEICREIDEGILKEILSD